MTFGCYRLSYPRCPRTARGMRRRRQSRGSLPLHPLCPSRYSRTVRSWQHRRQSRGNPLGHPYSSSRYSRTVRHEQHRRQSRGTHAERYCDPSRHPRTARDRRHRRQSHGALRGSGRRPFSSSRCSRTARCARRRRQSRGKFPGFPCRPPRHPRRARGRGASRSPSPIPQHEQRLHRPLKPSESCASGGRSSQRGGAARCSTSPAGAEEVVGLRSHGVEGEHRQDGEGEVHACNDDRACDPWQVRADGPAQVGRDADVRANPLDAPASPGRGRDPRRRRPSPPAPRRAGRRARRGGEAAVCGTRQSERRCCGEANPLGASSPRPARLRRRCVEPPPPGLGGRRCRPASSRLLGGAPRLGRKVHAPLCSAPLRVSLAMPVGKLILAAPAVPPRWRHWPETFAEGKVQCTVSAVLSPQPPRLPAAQRDRWRDAR